MRRRSRCRASAPQRPSRLSSGEDLNATRRTTRAARRLRLLRDSETRRTDGWAGASGRGARRHPAHRRAAGRPLPSPLHASRRQWRCRRSRPPAPPPTRRRRFALRGAGLSSCSWARCSSPRRSGCAARRRRCSTTSRPRPPRTSTTSGSRYRKLAPFSLLPGSGLGDVRDELRTALLKSADRVLNSYRGDDPSTTEKGWQKAHDRLRAAVDLDYRDRADAGEADLHPGAPRPHRLPDAARASGQKDRGAAEAPRRRRRVPGRRPKLAPDWPDPYLGLARVYSYEQPDLKQLEAALNELEKRGYPIGPPREGDARRRLPHAGRADPGAGRWRPRGPTRRPELLEKVPRHLHPGDRPLPRGRQLRRRQGQHGDRRPGAAAASSAGWKSWESGDPHGRDPQHRRRPPAAGDLYRPRRHRASPCQGLPGVPSRNA